MKPAKKLYRSRKNVIFGGIIGGFGEYFDVDPVVLRIVFIPFVIGTGVFPGVVAYFIAYFIVPFPPENGEYIHDAEMVGR